MLDGNWNLKAVKPQRRRKESKQDTVLRLQTPWSTPILENGDNTIVKHPGDKTADKSILFQMIVRSSQ